MVGPGLASVGVASVPASPVPPPPAFVMTLFDEYEGKVSGGDSGVAMGDLRPYQRGTGMLKKVDTGLQELVSPISNDLPVRGHGFVDMTVT